MVVLQEGQTVSKILVNIHAKFQVSLTASCQNIFYMDGQTDTEALLPAVRKNPESTSS